MSNPSHASTFKSVGLIEGGLVLACVGLRLAAAFKSGGIVWPDELYQYVEPAYGLVTGHYWLTSWEFFLGYRPMLYTLVNAAVFKIGFLLGVKDNSTIIFGCRLLAALFSTGTVLVLYYSIKRVLGFERALVAGVLMTFSSFLLEWSSRTMSEIPSSFFLAISFYFYTRCISEDVSGWRNGLLAGLSLLIAVILRPYLLVASGPYVFYLVWKRFGMRLAGFASGVVAGFLFWGGLDLATYGKAFSSLPYWIPTYKNILGRIPLSVEPADFYLTNALMIFSLVGTLLVVLSLYRFVVNWRKEHALVKIMLIMTALVVLSISIPHHKELRFIIPAVPFAFLFVGSTFPTRLPSMRLKRTIIVALVIAFIINNVYTTANADWTSNKDQTDAVSWIGRQKNLTGLICECRWWWSGVYTYLQRDVPVAFMEGFNVTYVFPPGNSLPSIDKLLNNDTFNYYLVRRHPEIANFEGWMFNYYGFTQVAEFGELRVFAKAI